MVIVMEAMKMETEIRSTHSGVISTVNTKEGDNVKVGDVLLGIG